MFHLCLSMIEAAVLDQIAQLRRELEMEAGFLGKKGLQASGALFGCLFSCMYLCLALSTAWLDWYLGECFGLSFAFVVLFLFGI